MTCQELAEQTTIRVEDARRVSVEHAVKEFSVPGRLTALAAVDDVSFSARRGMAHALVGESGSGKSTIARTVMGFEQATTRQVCVGGADMSSLRGPSLREARQRLQMVYQNPFSSLDPRQSIQSIIEEPLRNYGLGSRPERARRAREALELVALPATVADRRARELSGGQRQRVAIARAIVLDPTVMVLDEAVSALDVTVQAGILDLLGRIQQEFGTTYLFISHDLAVVRQVAQTVTVLRRGVLVESGVTEDIFANPTDPYTIALLEAIPGRTVAHT